MEPDGAVCVPAPCPQNQQFNYTWLRLIQHGELCLAPSGVVGAVGLRRCQGRSRSLAWLHGALATVQPGMVSDARGARDQPCPPGMGHCARRALTGGLPCPGVPHPLLPALPRPPVPLERCWCPPTSLVPLSRCPASRHSWGTLGTWQALPQQQQNSPV